MEWILKRLKEPSTWKGLATLLGGVGVSLDPALIVQIGVAVAAFIGAIEIFRAEDKEVEAGV